MTIISAETISVLSTKTKTSREICCIDISPKDSHIMSLYFTHVGDDRTNEDQQGGRDKSVPFFKRFLVAINWCVQSVSYLYFVMGFLQHQEQSSGIWFYKSRLAPVLGGIACKVYKGCTYVQFVLNRRFCQMTHN